VEPIRHDRKPNVAAIRVGRESVADPVEKVKDVVHSVEHPLETAKELEHEAEEGQSARTPLIAITGVTLFVGVILVIVLAIALTLYFVYGGK
jgi:hypothetical protein